MKGNFMFNKFFSFFLFSFILVIASSAYSAPKDKPPKKWPCDQVYNPQLNLSTIWQGPTIESALKDWWKHDDVIEYVNTLSDPTLNEEVGKQLIKEFAKKYTYAGLIKKAEQKEKLIFLFAGLYQKAKDRRSRQYKGIIKFVERQEDLRKAIGSSSKLIRKYRKEKLDQKVKNIRLQHLNLNGILEYLIKGLD